MTETPRADGSEYHHSRGLDRLRTRLHRVSRLFRTEDIPDAGDAARVFHHLVALLPLEQRGLTDELVRQRRALRQLDENFFRYYLKMGGRRITRRQFVANLGAKIRRPTFRNDTAPLLHRASRMTLTPPSSE